MSDVFEKNIVTIYGERGKNWLKELPSIIAKLAGKYEITQLEPVSNMSFNFVARGYILNTPIIVKLGLNSKALLKEAQCLKSFENNSVLSVVTNNEHMIIMECAEPGTTLKQYFPSQDSEAVNILCDVITKLHKASIPRDNNFHHVKELLKLLDKDLDIPHEILKRVRYLREKLLETSTCEVLLHGDLHHDNILKNGREWIAIDPKGFIGDPAFELAAFLCNPMPELLEDNNPGEIITNRIKISAKNLYLPEQRIKDWLYVKSVLCWAWSLEDQLDLTYWKKLLNIF